MIDKLNGDYAYETQEYGDLGLEYQKGFADGRQAGYHEAWSAAVAEYASARVANILEGISGNQLGTSHNEEAKTI